MKNETRGGKRPGAGRPATGRQKPNFTTTVSQETKRRIKALGFSRKAGRLFDEIIENFYLLAKQGDDFEVSVKNFVFRAVVNRNVFYGQNVSELLNQVQGYDCANAVQRERYNQLDSMYKYGEFDGEITRPFL